MRKPKKIAFVILAGLFVYLSLYTWNLRTGYLDAFSDYIGFDLTGYVLRPGQWVATKASNFWERYIYLVGLKQENDELRLHAGELRRQNMLMASQARAVQRLEQLLGFSPPKKWNFSGARVMAHRMGPAGVLDSIAVDKGALSGIEPDQPVVSLDGVVGRIMDTGATVSQVLLISDANSRIAVLGEKHRSPGLASGQGYGKPLRVQYMNLNDEIEPGELLLSSGLSGLYPKGLPVARVVRVQRSELSLFLFVEAEPLVNMASLEEVMILQRSSGEETDAGRQ